MKEKKSCWICRRTESEILQQVKKDEMEGYIDKENAFVEINDMYDNNYTKHICVICEHIIDKINYNSVKALVEDDLLKVEFKE